MGLRGALELRENQALTPYKVDAWESLLLQCNLHVKYPKLIYSLRNGFDAGIHPILCTYIPPNSNTLLQHPEAYLEMVSKEFKKGRYIGPCTRQEVETLIGPFQSSPLSWVPKPGKPGKYRAVHNFSFPHIPTPTAASINSFINADMYPCTWGTFDTVCFTMFNLPPGSQAAIRDVAEAYRTVPIIPDQWPGLVVKLLGEDQFAINTCNNFGLTSAGGIYGEIGDATLDIFRTQGIGPVSKWVDDHIFFRIPCVHRAVYNLQRQLWSDIITRNGGRHQSGSRFWYQGESMPDDSPAEFDEDAAHPITDYSSLPNRSSTDSLFTYCDADIDRISEKLGIPWEPSKTIPFSSVVLYLGFDWDLSARSVAIPERKRAKYSTAINDWFTHPTHDLEEVQKLYGKLLHASLVIPAGRAYLTSLESLMASFNNNPFVPHHAPRHTLLTSPGGSMSSAHPGSLDPSLARPPSRTRVPSQTPAQALASALLSATDGALGVSSRAGKQRAGTSDGLKPLASSFLLALSAQQASRANISGSGEITKGWLKDGGRAGVETGRQTKSSDESTTSQILTNAFLSHATSPAEKTQQMVPQEDSTRLLIVSSQSSAFQSLSGNISLIAPDSDPVQLAPSLDSSTTNRVRHAAANANRSLPLPTPNVLRPSRPSAYGPNLSPLPSSLRPHCLARDRLRLWRPSPAVCSRHSNGGGADLEQVFNMMSNAWAESTRESYSSGILVYHVYCDAKGIPEELRAPTSQSIVTSFIVNLAGADESRLL